jgi:hypothetical protein
MARILERRGDHRAAATYLALAALRWNEADTELVALVNGAGADDGHSVAR